MSANKPVTLTVHCCGGVVSLLRVALLFDSDLIVPSKPFLLLLLLVKMFPKDCK